MKIGLFYGSDTGNTESAAETIQTEIGKEIVDLHEVFKYPSKFNLTVLRRIFFHFRCYINRRIAGYATIYVALKMEKKTSKRLN